MVSTTEGAGGFNPLKPASKKTAFRPGSEPIPGAPCLASETWDEISPVILSAAKDLRISPSMKKKSHVFRPKDLARVRSLLLCPALLHLTS